LKDRCKRKIAKKLAMQSGPTPSKKSRGKLKHMRAGAHSCKHNLSLPIWLAQVEVGDKDLRQYKVQVC